MISQRATYRMSGDSPEAVNTRMDFQALEKASNACVNCKYASPRMSEILKDL